MSKTLQIILLWLTAFLWGSSFILMKRGLETFSYMQVAAMRIFFSFIILLPLIIKHIKVINRKNIRSFLLLSFIANGINAFLFTKAQTKISSSLAGILNILVPLFTLTIGIFFYRVKTTKPTNILGVVLGFLGAFALIFSGSKGNLLEGENLYGLFIILACLGYGFTSNEVKEYLSKYSGIVLASLAFLFSGPIAGLYLIFSDFSTAIYAPNFTSSLFYVFLLALSGSVLAVFLFYTLIKHTTALSAVMVNYLVPLFAVMWGVIDGEKFSVYQGIFALLIILGVYFVTKKK